ncbi:Integral membrane protein [Penicillium ucsense]|uniref:Integral membrane protein n=1 Tax=Penicillium ucsense TaxID=2839758 RepID=A0A8J8W2U5_9EURO|nr:Integral membrane protein [Penicillium ucsense]KAF7736771.1 Integral membrane protein [Penicillium ucsense]
MAAPGYLSSFYNRRLRFRLLKPILRAYALGYLSYVTPKIVARAKQLSQRGWTIRQKIEEILRVLLKPLRVDSFPTFCAILVGGSTISPVLLQRICVLALGGQSKSASHITRRMRCFIQFFTALLAAYLGFGLLNKNRTISRAEAEAHLAAKYGTLDRESGSAAAPPLPDLAGRTMDLTIFSAIRAADVLACMAWNHWARRRRAQNRWTRLEELFPGLADAGVFAMSAAVVMWAWFYLPQRLPRTYEKWIGEVAKVDMRLIEALRRARRGIFIYGRDTGQAPLLMSMCRDFGWPEQWGDPTKTAPIPCEMVHMGCGPNCEIHALTRFFKTFKVACATYVPLQIVFRLQKIKDLAVLRRAVLEGARSSAFLAAFVGIFYYAVCLARTRLGPKMFDEETVTPQMWDSGLCVGAGCLLCGWSILVEQPRKRQELALFVAPRAAATVLPRLYDKKFQYRERIAFAISAAILITTLRDRPRLVRGVFGKIAARVLN